MAKTPNQNNHLVLAYFPDMTAAQAAVDELEKWDQASETVQLGGIALLEYDDGRAQVHNVGARFDRPKMEKYGKAGLAVGVLAGIFSGGITVLGGAALGSSLGIFAGAVSHRELGITDGEQAEIVLHIKDGGAVLGIMVDDFEVQATRAKLTELGGKTKHFTILQDRLDQIVAADQVDTGENQPEAQQE